MELFYCVIIGILGIILGYWLTNRNVNKKVDALINKGILQNNQEYGIAERKLEYIISELKNKQEEVDNSDIVRDSQVRAEEILHSSKREEERIVKKAQGKVDKLEKEAQTARNNMLKEIEELREEIAKRVQSLIDGHKPITAEENLESLLHKSKVNNFHNLR